MTCPHCKAEIPNRELKPGIYGYAVFPMVQRDGFTELWCLACADTCSLPERLEMDLGGLVELALRVQIRAVKNPSWFWFLCGIIAKEALRHGYLDEAKTLWDTGFDDAEEAAVEILSRLRSHTKRQV